jgi:hypothetical protein
MRHLYLSALAQFVITAGTALGVAATDERITAIECVLAGIGGLVAAAKDVQSHLHTPPRGRWSK